MDSNVDIDPVAAAQELFNALWGNRFDWTSEHRKDSAQRFVRMMYELTVPIPFDFTTFDTNSDEMIVVSNIDFTSLCAHHLVPFIGKAYVAYIPQGKLVGLSKIPRLVQNMAKDLTVQEELTTNIANALVSHLHPQGVAVVLEAEHMCMSLRGVKAHGVVTRTSCMLGAFGDHEKLARSEFLSLIKG